MSRTRYGVSPWIDRFPSSRRPSLPKLRDDLEAPVAIVGAGLTGCCTAYALAAAGVQTVVLEGDRIGMAGAGRGDGVSAAEAGLSFREMEQRHGRRAARALFDASRRAVLDLSATIRRLSLRADLTVLDALRLARPESAGKELARDAAARRGANLEASWLERAALARLSRVEAARAVRLRSWAHCDPYRLALGFARAAIARGSSFFERSAVTRITFGRRDASVEVGDRRVRVQRVIVCTGEPTKLFRSLARHFRFTDRYTVMTAPMPAAMRKAIDTDRVITDAELPPHRIWRTADHRLVVSGADQPRPREQSREKALVQRTGQLMYEVSRLYPAMSGLAPELGWHVGQAETSDGAMYVGPHRNFPHHLFAWGTAHDPARAFLASRILLRHVQEVSDKSDAYFAFTRG